MSHLAMRERIRRGASKHAQGLGIQILSKLREQGISIAGVLDRCTSNNWTDLIRAASGMTPPLAADSDRDWKLVP